MVDFNTIKGNISDGIEALGSKVKGAGQKIVNALGHLWSLLPRGKAKESADRADSVGKQTFPHLSTSDKIPTALTIKPTENPTATLKKQIEKQKDWGFEAIYNNPPIRRELESFLEDEYSTTDNFDFLADVFDLDTSEKKREDYQELFDTYLNDESENKIEFPHNKNVTTLMDIIEETLDKSSLTEADLQTLHDSFKNLGQELEKSTLWSRTLNDFAKDNGAKPPITNAH